MPKKESRGLLPYLLAAMVPICGLFVIIRYIGRTSFDGEATRRVAGCGTCQSFGVRGDNSHLSFEEVVSTDGCTRLTITCGKAQGTEAIIQWYHGDQDLGVSFLDHLGQSNIARTLHCNENGQYELNENGHISVVDSLECIVAHTKEEL